MPHKNRTVMFEGFAEEECKYARGLATVEERLRWSMADRRKLSMDLRLNSGKPAGIVLAARGLSLKEEKLLDEFMCRHQDAIVVDNVEPGRTTHLVLGIYTAFDLVESFPAFLSLAARIPIVTSLWLLESLETVQPAGKFIINLKGARRTEPLFSGITFGFRSDVPAQLQSRLKVIIEEACGRVVTSDELSKAGGKNRILLSTEGTRSSIKHGLRLEPVNWVGKCLLLGTTGL